MKKLIAIVIAVICMLSMGGCQKAISGSEVFSFPEPTIQVKGTFYSQGTANEFTIGSEKYNPDDLSVIPIIEWFYNLELKECEEPVSVEGNEGYSFVVGNEEVFTYDDRGNTAFVIVNGKWFEVQNPTVPPIDFDSLTPNGSEQIIAMPSEISKVEISGYYNGSVIKPGDFVVENFDEFAAWYSQLSLDHRTFEEGKNPGEMYAGGDSYTLDINDGALSFTYAIGGSPVTEYIIYDEEWYEVLNPSELPLRFLH